MNPVSLTRDVGWLPADIGIMTVTIFDPRAFIKRLTAAGMPKVQAEVLAEEQSRLIGDGTATKADIASLRSEVATDLAVVKAEPAMVKWMVGDIGFGTIALVIRSFLHVPG